MPIPKINFNVPIFSMIGKSSWSQKIGHGLGHLWSLWTQTFHELIQRVRSATREIFASFQKKPSEPQNKPVITIPPIPQPPTEKIESQLLEPDADNLDLNDLFSEQEEPVVKTLTSQEQSKIETMLVHPASPLIPVVAKPVESQVQNADSRAENRTTQEVKFPLPVEINKIEAQATAHSTLESEDRKSDIAKVGKQEETTKENSTSQPETEFRRRRKRENDEIPPLTSTLNIPISELGRPTLINYPPNSTIKQASPAKEIEYTLIEAGGGGDCQLHAFLKGLEMQYPQLLKYKENNRQIILTSQKLRSLGVEFAREQIDHCGPYAEDVLAYLDADRKEYNSELVEPVKKQLKEDRVNLNQARKNRKITEADYKQKRQVLLDKYSKLISDLENKIIRTDEEFLKQLEQPGFYCSTLHLFALSAKLNVPIYVHHEDGVEGNDVEMFNPLKSTLAPIHLYRAGRHYQLKLYLRKEKSQQA
jgi:hypothetical protein